MRPAHFLSSVGVVLAFGVGGGGCKCSRDKPYVPYSIGDSEGGAAAAAGDAGLDGALGMSDVALEGGAPAAPLAVVRGAPGDRTLVIDGATFAAPAGQTVVGGAGIDWDGDGTGDAVVVLKADGTNPIGPLYAVAVVRGGKDGAPAVLASSPPLVECAPPASPASGGGRVEFPIAISRHGKSSLVVEIGSTCPNRSPSRWLAILATEGKTPRARFSVGIADPPGAHPLVIDADAIDRDGDGIDDVVLRTSLEGAAPPFEPGPKVTASLVWLDRTAGLSRDPEEPEASFRALTGTLASRAARAKEAGLVPVAVRQLRHLAHAVCAEGGVARLVQLAGATLPSCAGSRALEEAGLSEARSHATAGDALRAALAFDRAAKPPAAKTPARIKETQGAIEKLAPVLQATSDRYFAAVPDEPPAGVPSYGPLSFEADGHLLIRTKAGVVRADPASGDEADSGKPAWASAIAGGEGKPTLSMALSACDGVAIRALFNKSDGTSAGELLLPIVPPLAEKCMVPRGEPALVTPLAYGPSGLEAIVSGEPILIAPDASRAGLLASPLDAPGPPGAAKSLDGRSVVVPTGLGLLVRTARGAASAGPAEAGAHLLRARDLDGGYGELRDCVVSNDAHRVACLRGRRVVAGIWEN